MDYSDTTIVIPAKDEPAVGKVANKILKALPGCKIIIVYMGATPKVNRGIVLVKQKSKGYGAALKEGFAKARTGIVGMIDADGTYEPMDLRKVIALVRGGNDMAIGNRLTKANKRSMQTYIIIGNTLATLTYDILHLKRIGDTQSGLRAMRKKMLNSITLNENGWLLPPELNAKAANNGFKITDAPIKYYSRIGSSKLENKAMYGFQLFAMTVAFRFVH